MLIWEEIKQDTAGTLYRSKVPNGWLVKEVQDVHVVIEHSNTLGNHGYEWTSSLTFVPDINNSWEI